MRGFQIALPLIDRLLHDCNAAVRGRDEATVTSAELKLEWWIGMFVIQGARVHDAGTWFPHHASALMIAAAEYGFA